MRSTALSVAFWVLFLGALTACGGGGTIVVGTVGGAPAAQIQVVDMLGAGTGTTIQFFGQGADPDCTALTYAWDFDGNGTTDSAVQSPSFTYPTAGEFTVTLTVTDTAGDTATATCIASIRDAPAAGTTSPAVQVRCNTLLATTTLETYFNAAATDLDGGTIASFDWDFDGNGVFDLNTPLGRTSASYATEGQYTPRVRANSTDGSSSIATLTLYVCPAGAIPDMSPGVQLERHPTLAFDDNVGGTSSFMAPGADMDGGASTFAWDFDENGIFGDKVGRLVTTDPWPTETGIQIQVRATDDEGKVSSAQAALAIGPAGVGVDTPPIAFARACTLLASLDSSVQFLGTGDDLEDGPSGVTYSWDLDGDGAADSALRNPTFTFPVVGVYTPTLTVMDTTGHSSTAWLTLIVECCATVSGGPPPIPPPYWWCDCEDTYMFHGGDADIVITCPTIIGATAGPTEAGIAACNGSQTDINCTEVTISHPPGVGPGPPFFPPPGLFPVGPPPISFNVFSTAVDGPTRVVHYTVQVKLREAGVRVQQLKCQVFVLHGFIGGGGSGTDTGGGSFDFDLQIGINAPGGIQYPIPPIYDIEIVLNDQVPPWTAAGLDAIFGMLPPGWAAAPLPGGGIRLFTGTNPILPGQPLNIQGLFGNVGPGNPLPNSVRVRLSRQDGSIVGVEELPLTFP